MNKSELIDKLTSRLGDREIAAAAVDNLTDLIYRSIARGEPVTISGFGTFSKIARAPRLGRNPRTGETVKVRKSFSAKFKPGQRMRAVAKGEIKLGHEPKATPMLPSGVMVLLRQPAVREVVATREAVRVAAVAAAKRNARKPAAAKVATPAAPAPRRARKALVAPAAPAAAAPAVQAPRKRTAKAPAPVVAAPAPVKATRVRSTRKAAVAAPAQVSRVKVDKAPQKASVKATPAEPVKATRSYTRRAATTKATSAKAKAQVTSPAVKAAPRKPGKVAETNPAKNTVNKMRAPKVTVIKTVTKAPGKRAARKVAVSAK